MAGLDQTVFWWFFRLSGQNGTLDDLIIFLAQYLPYFLALGFIIFVFKQKNWKIGFLVFAEGAIAAILSRGLIAETIRFFYHRPRPFMALNLSPLINESGYSFPSGHAIFFFALALIIFYHSKRLGTWYFALSLINGAARVAVGVHWPMDIAGGVILGLLSAYAVHKLVIPYLKQIAEKKTSVSPAD